MINWSKKKKRKPIEKVEGKSAIYAICWGNKMQKLKKENGVSEEMTAEEEDWKY